MWRIPLCLSLRHISVGGFLGEDNVGDFETLFKKQGLEDKFHRVAGKTRINVKITETEADVTDLNFLGYQITPEAWQMCIRDRCRTTRKPPLLMQVSLWNKYKQTFKVRSKIGGFHK